MPLSALVTPIDEREPEPGTVVLSVSESRGIVPQTTLFKKRVSLENISKYKRVQPGDLAYNPFLLWNGAAGVCFEANGGCVSPAYQVLRPTNSGTEVFLHYFVRSEPFKSAVNGIASGTVTRRRTAPLRAILDLEFDLPSVPEQRRANAVLRALDAKIASNAATCSHAYEMAAALLELEVERDKVALCVDEVATFFNRRRVPLSKIERSKRQGSFPYYGAAGVLDSVDDFLFDGVFALVGEDGSVVREDGTPFTQYVWGKFWVNNHAHVIQGSEVSTELLLLGLMCARVRSHATGAVQPKLSMTNLKRVVLTLPREEGRARLEVAIAPLFALIRALGDESLRLMTLRDGVLPWLLNGSTVGAFLRT